MDEQNKTPETEAPKQEKKLSRTTLTFYIIGLFSIAIALILISYVAQSRADKQLDTLADQLSEQQTVAQGFAQKMEDLQKQLTQKTEELDEVRAALGITGADHDTAESVQSLRDTQDAAYQMLLILEALRKDDRDAAKAAFERLTAQYGADKLDGTGETTLLGPEGTEIYKALQAEFAA